MTRRSRTFSSPLLAAATTLAMAVPLAAQTPAGAPAGWAGNIEFGARATGTTGDAARYQRFRDLRSGPWLEAFRLGRDTERWAVHADATKLGYRDQSVAVQAIRYGRLESSFTFDGVPLFYSKDTATLHREVEPGRLVVDDAVQGALEARTSTIAGVIGGASSFDLRSQRNTSVASLVLSATRRTDVSIVVRNTERTGQMPWGGAFGFGNVVEVAAPLDQRTTDATAAAEWANGRGSVRVAYDGSWFNNKIETLIWDNPFRLTDAADGPATGRANISPSSTAHTVSTSGTVTLPGRTRGSAHMSVGAWLQDGTLQPFTTNTALPDLTLDRGSAEGEARVTAATYVLNSRPIRALWLNARYRYYDFDNRTPAWTFRPGYVRFDSSVVNLAARPEAQVHRPYGYTRHFLDLDASVSPVPFLALRAGFGREHDDRTGRYVERTTDDVVRLSVDSTGLTWATVRVQYEDAHRTGDGFDDIVLDDVGEQVSLRQFDISDRRRRRITVLGTLTPTDAVALNAAVGLGRDRRPDSEFGLSENDHQFYSFGVDLLASATVSFGVTYGFEHYTSSQQSRQANPFPSPCLNPPQAGCLPEFDDPRRNWTTDGEDRVHTASATIDLLKLVPRTDVRLSYDLSLARTKYTYLVPVDSTIPTVNQLPALLNELHRGMTDITYQLREAVSLGLGYWYDRYVVDDFAMGPATIDRRDLAGQIVLGYLNRPYRGHSAVLRVGYRW